MKRLSFCFILSIILCSQVHGDSRDYVWNRMLRRDPVTHEEMIHFFDQLEKGELDHLPEKEWKNIQKLVVLLTRIGTIVSNSDDREAVELEIQELFRNGTNE
jgi:hypothetical protein